MKKPHKMDKEEGDDSSTSGSTTELRLGRLKDDEIFQLLQTYGYTPGPVIPSTRAVYERILKQRLRPKKEKRSPATAANETKENKQTEQRQRPPSFINTTVTRTKKSHSLPLVTITNKVRSVSFPNINKRQTSTTSTQAANRSISRHESTLRVIAETYVFKRRLVYFTIFFFVASYFAYRFYVWLPELLDLITPCPLRKEYYQKYDEPGAEPSCKVLRNL